MAKTGNCNLSQAFFWASVIFRTLITLSLMLSGLFLAQASINPHAYSSCQVPMESVPRKSQDDKTSEAEEARLNASVTQLYNEGKYDGALTLAQELLAMREKRLGPDDLLVGKALSDLGVIYIGKRNFAQAEFFLNRALSITEAAKGPDD